MGPFPISAFFVYTNTYKKHSERQIFPQEQWCLVAAFMHSHLKAQNNRLLITRKQGLQ